MTNILFQVKMKTDSKNQIPVFWLFLHIDRPNLEQEKKAHTSGEYVSWYAHIRIYSVKFMC